MRPQVSQLAVPFARTPSLAAPMRPICRLLGTTSILALAVATTTLSAQAKDETLLHGGTGSVGFYITPVVKLTEVNSRGAVLGGIRAGVLFARRFGVGLARYAGGQHRFSDYDFRGGTGRPPPRIGIPFPRLVARALPG